MTHTAHTPDSRAIEPLAATVKRLGALTKLGTVSLAQVQSTSGVRIRVMLTNDSGERMEGSKRYTHAELADQRLPGLIETGSLIVLIDELAHKAGV